MRIARNNERARRTRKKSRQYRSAFARAANTPGMHGGASRFTGGARGFPQPPAAPHRRPASPELSPGFGKGQALPRRRAKWGSVESVVRPLSLPVFGICHFHTAIGVLTHTFHTSPLPCGGWDNQG